MIDRRFLLGLGALGLLLGFGLVLLLREGREEESRLLPGAPNLVAGAQLDDPPELVQGGAQGEPRVGARHPADAGTELPEPRVEPDANAAPARARLRGVLLRSSDRSPVSGVSLAFHFEAKSTIVMTDEQGRFETDPVLPAGVVRAWYIGVPEEGRQLRELDPTLFVVPEDLAPGEAHEIELVLREPQVWLEAQVLRPGLSPRARIEVHCQSTTGRRMWTLNTDSEGYARIGFSPIEPGEEVILVARLENEVSRPLRVVHPWAEEVLLLELEPAGEIAVSVVDPNGRPVPGQFVTTPGPLRVQRTDSSGRAVLGPLAPGSHTVRAGKVERSVVVPAGGVVEVELVLTTRMLLASGRVVDETGNGLAGVFVAVSYGTGSTSLETESDGGFVALREAGQTSDSVCVELGMGAGVDRFEPEKVVVPVGTEGLLFRRLPTPRGVELSFAFVDANTREPISDGSLFAYRQHSPGWCDSYSAQDGLVVRCLVRPLADVLFLARAQGYRDLAIGWEDLPQDGKQGELVTLALEAGFSRAVRVLAWDEKPILGAHFQIGERLLAMTDADGRAWIDLGETPDTVRVSADGYESTEWDSSLDEVEGIIWLDEQE